MVHTTIVFLAGILYCVGGLSLVHLICWYMETSGPYGLEDTLILMLLWPLMLVIFLLGRVWAISSWFRRYFKVVTRRGVK